MSKTAGLPPNLPNLPTGHFLSLPPSFASGSNTRNEPASTSSHLSNGLAPNVASLAAADFDVDVRTGFLPASKNLERLVGEWEIWEDALDAAKGGGSRGLRLGGTGERERLWRRGIEAMPILDTRPLESKLILLRRAHVVLAFLCHFYAHTTPSTSLKPLPIPSSISIPLLTVSRLLGLPPILTYSDTVLWNFHSLNTSIAPSLPINPPTKALVTFTGTSSEEQFYIISALCEIAGAEALRLMRQSLDELFLADKVALRRLTIYLRKLAIQIDRIGDITLSIMQGVDPEEFYHLIRPWFKGGDSDGQNSSGWAYLGADDIRLPGENMADRTTEEVTTRGRLFSGPSAGQSSLIHAIDIFLSVDHTEQPIVTTSSEPNTATTATAVDLPLNHSPSTDPTPSKPNEATFVQRMLQYMPLPHRSFLLHLSTHPTPLRPLVLHYAPTHPKLAQAYDGALEALKRFREKHMRIVSLYIVQQARRAPSQRIKEMLGQISSSQSELDEEEVEMKGEEGKEVGELRGTGGTPLFKFLKRCRDNTTKAMVGKQAGPGFDLV